MLGLGIRALFVLLVDWLVSYFDVYSFSYAQGGNGLKDWSSCGVEGNRTPRMLEVLCNTYGRYCIPFC